MWGLYMSCNLGKVVKFEMKTSKPGKIIAILDLDKVMEGSWNFAFCHFVLDCYIYNGIILNVFLQV